MSKVSFSKSGAPVVEADEAQPEVQNQESPAGPRSPDFVPESETQTETAGTNLPGPRASFPFNEDDVPFGDIKFPKIHITQKVGQLSNVFTPGEIIFNLQLPIYTPPVVNQGVQVKPGSDPLYVVVIGFRKDRYAEEVPQGSNVQGLLLNTLKEVEQAGGTLDYREHKQKLELKVPVKLFKTLATALFLVRKPADVEDPDRILFPFVCEDHQYVLATFDMKGGSFTNGAQVIRQAKKIGHLQAGGYSSFSWSLGTMLKQWQTGNSSFIPVLKPATRTNETLRAFIKNITGNE